MDPDVLLALILQEASEVIDAREEDEEPWSNERSLAEHVVELHEWIKKGGFLPADWKEVPA